MARISVAFPACHNQAACPSTTPCDRMSDMLASFEVRCMVEPAPVVGPVPVAEPVCKKRKAGHGSSDCMLKDEEGRYCDSLTLEVPSDYDSSIRMDQLRKLLSKADKAMRRYELSSLAILFDAMDLVPVTMPAAERSMELHRLKYVGRKLISQAWAAHEDKAKEVRAAIRSINRTRQDFCDQMIRTPRWKEFHCHVLFKDTSMQGKRALEDLDEIVEDYAHIDHAFFVIPHHLTVSFVDGHVLFNQVPCQSPYCL